MVAKLSVLRLPSNKVGEVEETPFALVLSNCDAEDFGDLSEGLTTFKENCGARGVLVTDFEIEIDPTVKPAAEVRREVHVEQGWSAADEALADAVERSRMARPKIGRRI